MNDPREGLTPTEVHALDTYGMPSEMLDDYPPPQANLTPVAVPVTETAQGRRVPLDLPLVMYRDVTWEDSGAYGESRGHWTEDPSEAELFTSELRGRPGWHAPILDLDIPAALVPSTTPGHSHLYLDKPMPWATYERLLDALGEAGILEPGYVEVSKRRARTDLRAPWTRKPYLF